jgi:hypothetical protein
MRHRVLNGAILLGIAFIAASLGRRGPKRFRRIEYALGAFGLDPN